MKKTERLNDMIIYLNNLEFFNLKDLMYKYNISKSTALRDIRSLEQLGMCIYSEQGKYGRYGILKNRLLSPIIFSFEEVYALYFAMLTLKSYQSTPFHFCIDKLNMKFKNCLSKEQIKQISQMRDVLQFEVYQHSNTSKFLDKILQSILSEVSCKIKYLKNDKEVSYNVQFFKISAKFGQWYVNGIIIGKNEYKTFRCDKIISLEVENNKSLFTVEELIQNFFEYYRNVKSIEYEVEILEQAKDIFYKECYPSMKIEIGTKTIIKGIFNLGEEEFISNYFIRYGTSIKSIKPESLKLIIYEKLRSLINYYEKI